MRTHVALLRGINVGGKNKVAMADLRRVVSSLGHTEVTTYIQSGNVLFNASSDRADAAAVAEELELAVAEQLDVRAAVVVASRNELDRVIEHNPFAEESNPRAVHAVFLAHPPDDDQIAATAEAVERAHAKGSRDEARVVGAVMYLWTPDGLGRSVLAGELTRRGSRRAAPPTGTARNWATVTALRELFSA